MQIKEKKDFKTITKDFGEEGLFRVEEFTTQYREIGITRDNIDELIEIALDEDLELYNSPIEKERYIPCHAITALGQLKAVEAFDKLLKRLEFFEKDTYYREAVLYYLKKVSYLRLDDLIEYFLDRRKKMGLRLLTLEGIEEAFKNDKSFCGVSKKRWWVR